VPVGVYHQVDELVQAIEVQPDRGQRPSIGPLLLGSAASATCRLGDVARIQTLGMQEARQTIGKRTRLSPRGTCAIVSRSHDEKARLARRWKASACGADSPFWLTCVSKAQRWACLGMVATSRGDCRAGARAGSAAVYLAAGYALREPRDCAIDERLGVAAPDHDQPDMPARPE
jgi:hypothetical protein